MLEIAIQVKSCVEKMCDPARAGFGDVRGNRVIVRSSSETSVDYSKRSQIGPRKVDITSSSLKQQYGAPLRTTIAHGTRYEVDADSGESRCQLGQR